MNNRRPIVDRSAILRSFGAGESEIVELLRYTQRPSASELSGKNLRLAMPDEPFADVWRAYSSEAEAGGGVWETLRRKLIQLRFPVSEGRSLDADYQAATRKGVWPDRNAPGMELDHPDQLALQLQPTAAGTLPFLYTAHRADFEKLVQALTHRNEPWPVPASMGACLVAGYNNWERIGRLRAAWLEDNKAHYADSDSAWNEEFAGLQPQKALYQDTFLILSGGPYSAVPAQLLGLTGQEWERLSVAIRLEHECAHYVTRRFFGVLSRRLDEELLADFAGLAAAVGRYPADWALRFLVWRIFRAIGRAEGWKTIGLSRRCRNCPRGLSRC